MSAKELDFTAISDEVKQAILPDHEVENVLLTVGSVLRGDDAAGPYLAKLFEDDPIEDWTLVQGDLTPEDEIGYIRLLHPKQLIIVDAADMSLDPGEVRIVTKNNVAKQFFITTHSMPITYLLSELEQTCETLTFIGIQPAQTEFYGPLTPAVKDAVLKVYELIKSNCIIDKIERL